MIKLPHSKVNFNEEAQMFSVSFRLPKDVYDTIASANMVEDFGLAILKEMQREVRPIIELDSPSLPPVDIK